MINREKVIKGLHCCSHTDGVNCIYCPYDISDSDCTALMSMDVLELLKEQEPKPIVNKWHKNPFGDYSRLHCPWCDRELDMQSAKEYVACPYCGKAVKWNE